MLLCDLFLCLLPVIPLLGIIYYYNKIIDYHFRIERIKWDAERKIFPGLTVGDEEDIAALKKEEWKCVGSSAALAAISAFFTFLLFPL